MAFNFQQYNTQYLLNINNNGAPINDAADKYGSQNHYQGFFRSEIFFHSFHGALCLEQNEHRTENRLNIEHRTSNVEHRIKKQTSNTEYSTAISLSFQPF